MAQQVIKTQKPREGKKKTTKKKKRSKVRTCQGQRFPVKAPPVSAAQHRTVTLCSGASLSEASGGSCLPAPSGPCAGLTGGREFRRFPVPKASIPPSTHGVTYPSLPRTGAVCRDLRQRPRQQVSILTYPCPGTNSSHSFFSFFKSRCSLNTFFTCSYRN